MAAEQVRALLDDQVPLDTRSFLTGFETAVSVVPLSSYTYIYVLFAGNLNFV